MKDLTNILEGFEKLAYEILIWFIMIPKTLLKIISDPGWVPGYVQKELDENESKKFDDYFSPVILFLFVSLVPFAIFNTYKIPGISIEGPVEGTVGEEYAFTVKGDFVWTSPSEYAFTWSIYSNEDETWVPLEPEPFRIPGSNDKTQDTIGVTIDQTGQQRVQVEVTNNLGEYYSYIHPIYIEEEGVAVDTTPQNLDVESKKTASGVGDLSGTLKGESSLFAGLLFLSFPLVFTLLTGGGKGSITGSSLRQTFYMQCYYFSPLFMAYYVAQLTFLHFYIPTIGFLDLLGFLTTLLFYGMFIWFIIAELQFVRQVIQKPEKRSTFWAFVRVIGIIALIFLVAGFGTSAAEDQDFVRGASWSLYLVFVLATFLVGLRRWWINRKARGEEPGLDAALPPTE